MACQLLINRAAARNFAKNEKKENSVGESVGRFLFSLLRQLGGEVEESDQSSSRPAPAIKTLGTRRYSSHDSPVTQPWPRSQVSERTAERNNNISSVRRSLLDSVLRRVTNRQAAHLRRKVFDQLTINGNSAPFLALVGVSLGLLDIFLSSHYSSVSQLQGRESSPRRMRWRVFAVRSGEQSVGLGWSPRMLRGRTSPTTSGVSRTSSWANLWLRAAPPSSSPPGPRTPRRRRTPSLSPSR